LYVKTLRPLAETYQEYLKFVTVDAIQYADMSRAMGLKSARGIVVENTRTQQFFPMQYSGDDGISAEEVATFITAVSQGLVQPWTEHGSNIPTPAATPAGSGINYQIRDEL
jgi:protein disulfide-isomerase A1